MHKVNKADINYSFNDGEKLKKSYDYSRTTLSIGYKFNFNIRGFNASFLTKEVVSNEKDVRNFDFRSNIIRM